MLWTILCVVVAYVAIMFTLSCLGMVVHAWADRPVKPRHKPTMGKPLRVALIILFLIMVIMEVSNHAA